MNSLKDLLVEKLGIHEARILPVLGTLFLLFAGSGKRRVFHIRDFDKPAKTCNYLFVDIPSLLHYTYDQNLFV